MNNVLEPKDLTSCIAYIRTLSSGLTFTLLGPHTSYHLHTGSLTKGHESGYSFEFEEAGIRFAQMEDIRDVQLDTQLGKLSVPTMGMSNISGDSVSGTVHQFSSVPARPVQLLRYRFVIVGKGDITFHNYFSETGGYKVDDFQSRELIRIQLAGSNFYLYVYPFPYGFSELASKKLYVVVESENELTLEDFRQRAYSILLAYGFVTGYAPLDEGFYFGYENEAATSYCWVHYSVLVDSVRTPYNPINANAYSLIRDPAIAEGLNKKLKGISSEVFSKLCETLLENPLLSSGIFLLLEGGAGSLHQTSGNYAICLEALTGFFADKEARKLNPIKDDILARKIVDEMKQVIDRHKAEIGGGYEILVKNVNKMNQPTNRDKLTQPFELLGISLNADDIKCIDARNDFLHGRMPGAKTRERLDDKQFGNIFHIAMKLNFLCCAILLKHCGFSGWVVNYAKLYELFTKVLLDEEIYREI